METIRENLILDERADPHQDSIRRGPEQTRTTDVPQILRYAGAIILLASAATFMVQQWSALNDLTRYASFLGLTILLTGAGFLSGFGLNDSKGARTFLGIVAAILPVHFLQLGALTFSAMPGNKPTYPAYLHWEAPGALMAWLAVVVAMTVLVPVTAIAFRTLVRSVATSVGACYLLANAVLLLPVREAGVMGFLALAMMVGLALFDRYVLTGQIALKTVEGKWVRIMLCVPFVALVARTCHLYPTDRMFVAALFACAAYVMFDLLPRWIPSATYTLRTVALFFALPAWGIVAVELLPESLSAARYALPVTVLPFAAMMQVVAAYRPSISPRYRMLSCILAVGGMMLQLAVFGGILSSFLCIFAGVMAILSGSMLDDKLSFRVGIVGLGVGLLYHLRFAAKLYEYSPWVCLAVLGTAIVLGASYLERRGTFGRKMVK